jgi:hypothetical protein
LSGADETKGMNAKMTLDFIKKKQPVQDEKEVCPYFTTYNFHSFLGFGSNSSGTTTRQRLGRVSSSRRRQRAWFLYMEFVLHVSNGLCREEGRNSGLFVSARTETMCAASKASKDKEESCCAK